MTGYLMQSDRDIRELPRLPDRLADDPTDARRGPTQTGIDRVRHEAGGRRRERPSEMTVAGVVEDPRPATGADARQHAWRHRTQAGPRDHALGRHIGKKPPRPRDQRAHPIVANVAIEVVELGGAGDAQALGTEPAGDDLRLA